MRRVNTVLIMLHRTTFHRKPTLLWMSCNDRWSRLAIFIVLFRLEVFPDPMHTDGKLSFSPSGEFILTNFKLRLRSRGSSQYREIAIAHAIADVDGQGKDEKYAGVAGTLDDDPRTGWTTRNHPADHSHWAIFVLSAPLVMADDEALDIILMQRSIENQERLGRFAVTYTDRRGAGN